MTNKRNIGTVAALGGLTAAVALITALPSARADELSDLRANQELLQRRVDAGASSPAEIAGPGCRRLGACRARTRHNLTGDRAA